MKGSGFLATGLSGSSGFNRLFFRFFSPNGTQERHPAERHATTQIDDRGLSRNVSDSLLDGVFATHNGFVRQVTKGLLMSSKEH